MLWHRPCNTVPRRWCNDLLILLTWRVRRSPRMLASTPNTIVVTQSACEYLRWTPDQDSHIEYWVKKGTDLRETWHTWWLSHGYMEALLTCDHPQSVFLAWAAETYRATIESSCGSSRIIWPQIGTIFFECAVQHTVGYSIRLRTTCMAYCRPARISGEVSIGVGEGMGSLRSNTRYR